MRSIVRTIPPLLLLLGAVACYRLPMRIRENDATGYEDVGIPVIEAVEYTPMGRDLRVTLDAPGYVTVIIVDPEVGASVRFRRGELQSVFGDKGLHRYALDRLSSPLLLSQMPGVKRAPPPDGLGRTPALLQPRFSPFAPLPAAPVPATAQADSSVREFRLSSRSIATGGGAVTSAHVVVVVTERPLDYVNVAMRLARGSLDPAMVAQSVADVIEGGRWMAAVAKLR